jgi:hypothetical protein
LRPNISATLAVYITPVADTNNYNAKIFVFNSAQNTIIANAITPKPGKVSSKKGFANSTRIFVFRDPLTQIINDTPLDVPLQP